MTCGQRSSASAVRLQVSRRPGEAKRLGRDPVPVTPTVRTQEISTRTLAR